VLGVVTRGLGRLRTWRGEYRYLAVALVLHLALGAVLLALGAAELAWVWLVPAAALVLAPRGGRAAVPLAVVATLLPAVLVLHPSLLREAAWHGFLPDTLPLAALVGVSGAPMWAVL